MSALIQTVSNYKHIPLLLAVHIMQFFCYFQYRYR